MANGIQKKLQTLLEFIPNKILLLVAPQRVPRLSPDSRIIKIIRKPARARLRASRTNRDGNAPHKPSSKECLWRLPGKCSTFLENWRGGGRRPPMRGLPRRVCRDSWKTTQIGAPYELKAMAMVPARGLWRCLSTYPRKKMWPHLIKAFCMFPSHFLLVCLCCLIFACAHPPSIAVCGYATEYNK